MHLAIDLDDCVLDFMEGLRICMKKEYDADLPPFTEWDLHKVLDPIIGESWWKWMRERDWLWANFPAMDGAIGALGQLRRDGHYLECVTSKPEWAEFAVWKWLGKWRPPFNQVTIVPVGADKSQHTAADVLVDDKPENVENFINGNGIGILFERPHNDGHWGHRDLIRASGWPAVVSTIRRLENGRPHV
jgi:5'(3')-deoxyribonucleotidase